MWKSIIPVLLITLILYGFARQELTAEREEFIRQNYMDYTMPSRFTGPASMEFKGIVSDFLFLKVITFIGEKIGEKQKFDDKYVVYLTESINAITDLDPYFWDAYLFSNMFLTWELHEIEAANTLLFKARKYRPNDFRIPYYIAFNYFYFLGDNVNGAKYLMEAAKLPGSPPHLAHLAARLSMYSAQYGTAIVFLKEILDETKNRDLAQQIVLRIKTLIILDKLEKKVKEYKEKFSKMPDSLNDLITSRIIESIPEDPYGGRFVLLENGRVFTTSKMVASKNTHDPSRP